MKKAQATAFIIIGLIVLISVILFLFIKGSIERKEIAPGVSAIVEELPVEFMPIQPFVESCIEKTAKRGLKILGERGGYIYTEKLSPSNKATEGNSVRFSPQSELILPYWHYLSSTNDCLGECEFSSEKIPLEKSALHDSIENQLERYVEENIEPCFNGFRSIEELGFEVEAENKPKANAIIAENNIVVQLKYPMRVSRRGSTFELNSFYKSIDLNLKDVYRMAEYLAELQQEYRFLEKAALNWIVAFSGKDERKLPPMSDSAFELNSKVRWKKSIVRNNVENMLVSYVPMLRVAGTKNWKEIGTGSLYIDKLYNYGMSIPNNISISHVAVNFNYLDFWDIYFNLNCDGQICVPESGFTDLLPIGIQRYNFAYDISYPVLVEIYDPSAYNNRGYSFSFLLESNIRNNKAMPAVFTPLASLREEGSMLCDENKKTGGEITIEAINALDSSGIDNVEVMYSCIDSCYIGETRQGMLKTSLPVCLGGTLIFRKQGFEEKHIRYDSSLKKPGTIKAELNPKKSIQIDIRKKLLEKKGNEWVISEEAELEEDETAVLALSNRDYSIIEFRKGSEESIELSTGTYEIDLSIISEREFYIPPEKREMGGEIVYIPEFNTSSLILGKAMFNYTFRKKDLQKDRMTFYVIAADPYSIPLNERTIEALDVTKQFSELTKKYYDELVPR
ncbi:hypothetical protein GF323_01470 [Candidatus Woesearchaeota archaeon]|nr:hypothetical protein [Candidatus Woesearchaeota archaeon]